MPRHHDKSHFTFGKPHIGFDHGKLNFGVRTDINLGGLHVKSSNNTIIGNSGYEHTESGSTGINGFFNTEDKKSNTINRNGIADSRTHKETFAGIYAVDARQSHDLGPNGYHNQWSLDERVGGVSTSLSHSAGIDQRGVHATDTIGVYAGNDTLVDARLPGVVLGGTNPYFQSSNESTSSHASGSHYSSNQYDPSCGPVSSGQGYFSPASGTSMEMQYPPVVEEADACCFPRLFSW